MKSRLTVAFTAGWTARAAPAPQTAARSDMALGAARSRCERIFAMSGGSSILAVIFSAPPQPVQLSIPTPNDPSVGNVV